MLKNFLYIYEAIRVVINTSRSKAFKNKSIVLTDIEIIYLNNILNNISIFIKIKALFLKALDLELLITTLISIYIYKKFFNI